jgi:hypothetical protein
LLADFHFTPGGREVLEPNLRDKRGMSVPWSLLKHRENCFALQVWVFAVASSEWSASYVCCTANYCYAQEACYEGVERAWL